MNKILSCLTRMSAAVLVTALVGCASTSNDSSGPGASPSPNKFKAEDGRTIDIGKSTPAEGGVSYKNPHMEKGKCWVASGFNFTGYDTIYVAPMASTAKVPDKPQDQRVHDLAKDRFVLELVARLNERKLFATVVTKESEIKPEAKVLRFENTITEFSKGGGGARFWGGEFGAGQPVLRVQGRLAGGDKAVFTYEARRTGVSAGARMAGSFMKDEDIQTEDIRSIVLDLTDFMAALAGKYQPKN